MKDKETLILIGLGIGALYLMSKQSVPAIYPASYVGAIPPGGAQLVSGPGVQPGIIGLFQGLFKGSSPTSTYKCWDGTMVSNPSLCPPASAANANNPANQTYTCPDGYNTVTDLSDCPPYTPPPDVSSTDVVDYA